jgi:hypothetical protein
MATPKRPASAFDQRLNTADSPPPRSQLDGLPGVSPFRRDSDGVKNHVRGAEFGAVVVAVLADALRYLAGLVQVDVCVLPIVVTRGRDGAH